MKKALLAVCVLALFAPSLIAQNKKVLTLADYGQWKRITSTVMSDDDGRARLARALVEVGEGMLRR